MKPGGKLSWHNAETETPPLSLADRVWAEVGGGDGFKVKTRERGKVIEELVCVPTRYRGGDKGIAYDELGERIYLARTNGNGTRDHDSLEEIRWLFTTRRAERLLKDAQRLREIEYSRLESNVPDEILAAGDRAMQRAAKKVAKVPKKTRERCGSPCRPKCIERIARQPLNAYSVAYNLMYWGGLRIGEVESLTWRQLAERPDMIFIPAAKSKSGCDGETPVLPELREILLAWIAHCRKHNERWGPDESVTGLTARQIRYRLDRDIGCAPHQLRHAIGYNLQDMYPGLEMKDISTFLRHTSTGTTEKYYYHRTAADLARKIRAGKGG
jgi:integrase